MSRLSDGIVMRQGAHGPGRDSRRLKGEEAVRRIDFGDWWGVGFSHTLPCQAQHSGSKNKERFTNFT
jgi:hypothetical protein